MDDLVYRAKILEELSSYEKELQEDRAVAIETDDENMLFAIRNQETAIYRIKRNIMNIPIAYDVCELISRSDVLDLLYSIFDKYRMSTDKNTSIGKSFGTDVFEGIKNIPTAFDISRVVSELQKKENEAVLKAPNTSDITNPEYQKWMMKSYGFKESIDVIKSFINKED